MNCESVTRIDTSSLYMNGRLIAQSSVSFRIKRCSDLDFKISSNVFYSCNRRMLRVCLVAKNSGDITLCNGLIKVTIIPSCCNCNTIKNSIFKEFYINNLNSKCSEYIWINLPYPCNICYRITGKVQFNNGLFKEDSITI